MKRLEKILVNVLGTIVGIYAAIVLLFSLPFMQQRLAVWTSRALSDYIGAEVGIGSINLGLLNRVVVSDVSLQEPSGQHMASVARVSASVNVVSLLKGEVRIGTAQLFGVRATLYRNTPDSEPNFQFLIDAFKSEEQKESAPFHLHVGSFIMRHADVSYDVKSEQFHPNTLDLNHLHLHDCGVNAVLKCLTDDSLNVSIRRLQARELNSRLSIRNSQLRLTANRQKATLNDFRLSLLQSQFSVDTLQVQYDQYESSNAFRISSSTISATLVPSDFSPFYETLAALTSPVNLRMRVHGDERKVNLPFFEISSDDDELNLRCSASIEHPLVDKKRSINVHIQSLQVSNREIAYYTKVFVPTLKNDELISAIENVQYDGEFHLSKEKALTSKGHLTTGLGYVSYDLSYDQNHWIDGTIEADSIHLGKLLSDDQWGVASFDASLSLNLKPGGSIPVGRADGNIHRVVFNGYCYQQIELEAQLSEHRVEGVLQANDENLKAYADFAYADAHASKGIQIQLALEKFVPHLLRLTDKYEGESLSLTANVDLHGTDFQHLYGVAQLNDITLATQTELLVLNRLALHAERLNEGTNLYTIGSDLLNGKIVGNVSLQDIVPCITHQVALHLPAIVKSEHAPLATFTYDLTLKEQPILHHFIEEDFSLDQPLHIQGGVQSDKETMQFIFSAPCLQYKGAIYDNIAVTCNSTADNMNMHAIASTSKESMDDDVPSTSTKIDLTADVHQNLINSDLYVNMTGRNHIIMQLLPVVQFSDSLGSMKTDILLRKSTAVINDSAWTVSPSRITLYKKDIECHHVKFASDNADSYLAIDGKASPSPHDSIVATLNKLEIKYLLSMVDFDAVRFAGRASGKAIVNNVMGSGVPNLRANLFVEDLSVQEGPIGNANIEAHWDKDVDGISVDGRIVDLYQVPDGLTGRNKNVTGITTVNGWISPAKNDIQLNIDTHNTNAAFIHGFLGGVFKEVAGYVSGPISVVGPLNNVNLVGDAVPNMNLRLRATNVPYHIEGDTIRLRPYLFDFRDISLYDRFGHRSTISGQVTHRNMKNFGYHFKADLHELLAYDEKEFNSDKFLATVFADGTLSIDGSDGHPLYVNASVTPTKGSVFAYDAATPDAITGNSFIEFRDRDSLIAFNPYLFDHSAREEQNEKKDSLTILKEAKKNYDSDIFINFDINLTPACEVKLRMDNIDDGYMRTFGNAKLTAKWYNKGAFQLFGNYNIESGFYRLYLQDIIFRDLALQPGSMVEFNGNPFDANIHLICHHIIPSVPLSDLTATTAFSQNNKVRVICILDITGKLGNMDFSFDMDIPNVNEEVRQLVRSMINSEEEMNTQMIYLLGLGRFYPNEYARANGTDNSNQVANSLLSSTLSGQINQMLSNMIGTGSNWNIGSSLSTGEKGWDDLDVEGVLSGRLLDERLLINGAFGYRDNALTNQASFIGDFEVKWRMNQKGSLYLKAYNQTNDRYFTKSTLNTQGLGLSWQHDFETIRRRMKAKEQKTNQKSKESRRQK